jgi:hypothetical protein
MSRSHFQLVQKFRNRVIGLLCTRIAHDRRGNLLSPTMYLMAILMGTATGTRLHDDTASTV